MIRADTSSLKNEPPNDIEAERALLGAAFCHMDHLPAYVGLVNPEDFYVASHRAIWRAVQRLYAEGSAVDVVTVAGALQDAGCLEEVGGRAALAHIAASAGSAQNAIDYANRVAMLAKRRRVINAASKLNHALRGDDMAQVDSLISEIEQISQEGLTRPAATLPLIDMEALLKEDLKIPWLVPGRIARGDLIFWAGPGGVGKSWLAYDLCVCLSIGREWLGTKPAMTGPTLYIDAENPRHGIKDKMSRLYHPAKKPPGLEVCHQPGVTFDTPTGIGRLRRTIEAVSPLLVVIDPLYMFHDGNENSSQEMAKIMRPLRRITYEMGVTIIILHHEVKDPENIRTGATKMRGTAFLRDICDQQFSIVRTAYGNKFSHEKARHQDAVPTIIYKKEDIDATRTRLVVVDAPAATRTDIRCVELLAWLNAQPIAQSASEIVAEFKEGRDWHERTIYRVLAECVRRGWVEKSEYMTGGARYISIRHDIKADDVGKAVD